MTIETFSHPATKLEYPAITVCKKGSYNVDEYVRAVFDNFAVICQDDESCSDTEPLRADFSSYLKVNEEGRGSVFQKMYDNALWAGIAWPNKLSYIDAPLQPYLLDPRRLKSSNHIELRNQIGKKFNGQLRDEDNDQNLMMMGYFWLSTNISENEVKRTRKTMHDEWRSDNGARFPETDPYKKLYELADSDNATSFWVQLEDCQQIRSKVTLRKT